MIQILIPRNLSQSIKQITLNEEQVIQQLRRKHWKMSRA